MRVPRCGWWILCAVSLVGSSGHATAQTSLPQGSLDALRYRHIGPVGNRVSAVAGVPGEPNVFYFGAASGGVWKSEDGGVDWQPIFDDQPAQSIGAIAVAPSDPNVLWVGTGEAHIRSNVSIGNGVYRSTDAGRSFQHVGLERSGRIGRIVVDPRDPDIAFVAALGHLYGPQEERGVFRTRDGGATWERVLFVDDSTGAVDLVMDPGNPRILFAATWQMWMRSWGRWSGGPGSGIWRSDDGGDTWQRLSGSGLPGGPVGKIGLAMSRASSDRVYALIETSANQGFAPVDDRHGVLWRSDDGGRSWQIVSRDHTLMQRPLYYTRTVAAPDDPDEVHFLSTRFTTSRDGGRTVEVGNPGGDHHDMWIDPADPDRMIVGHDQGVSISTTRGQSWMRPRLPIAQMYHVYTDRRIPYRVYGNRQDGASQSGPSNSLTGRGIPIGMWHSVGGCESGYAVPDPGDENIVWSGCYDGILERYDFRTGRARTVSVWPDNPEGWPASDVRYRFQWTFPIAISPHDNARVYVGSQHVHRTEDGGQSWEVISPDLSTGDSTLMRKTGGLTPDDSSPTYAAVLFAIAESPLQEGQLWAGTNDGRLHLSEDGGGSWRDVSGALPGLPPLGTISNIEPSRWDAGTAYVSVDLHQLGDTRPWIFRTRDLGASWESIGQGIPEDVFSYVHVVREDPVRPGLLYVGTENGIWISRDDGGSWEPLQSNLPHAPVHWLDVQPDFNDLVVATYGRGFWILDDVTPLQGLDETVIAADAHLFPPRAAWRFLNREAPQSQPGDPGAGEDPPYGATLHAWLDPVPAEGVHLRILDQDGALIRDLGSRRNLQRGLNRFVWDLGEESSARPRLRTQPREHAHVEFNDDGWRPLGEGGRVTPLAAPGRYVVEMSVGDSVLRQTLEVRPDPTSEGTPEDIRAQVAFLRELRTTTDSVVALIDEMEWLRSALLITHARLREDSSHAVLARQTAEVEQALGDLEMELFDLRLTGGNARQDTLRWPRRLFARLTSLAGYMRGTDHPPTDQARAVYQEHLERLEAVSTGFREIRDGPLRELNRALSAAGMGPVT